jgi:hypothetical protein
MMKIGHVSYFGIGRSGLYEASRDMFRADMESGHEVYFFDAGLPDKDGRKEIQVGAVDDRDGFKLITSHPDLIEDCDILIMHTGIDDKYVVKSTASIIWMLHGKPLDCFRPEEQGGRNSYTLYKEVCSWKRCKKAVYFWPDYTPFWLPIIPKEKLHLINHPVIDENRFNGGGDAYIPKDKGKYNVMICDSSRTDIDLFELGVSCIEVAKVITGIKFHFVGSVDIPIKPCWKYVLDCLEQVGGLGDIVPRVTNMSYFYRGMDILFTPNRIENRCAAEALCCGLPVMGELGNPAANYTCCVPITTSVVGAFKAFIKDFDKDRTYLLKKALEHSKLFNLENYSNEMNKLYNSIM